MNLFNPASCLSFIIILVIALTHPALAATGKISGQAVDRETGEPLPGVNVFIETVWQSGKEVPLEIVLGAATAGEGYYVILNVPPGTYTVKASMIGYADFVKQQVRVNIDRTTVLDFEMVSSTVELEAIQVTAEREVIRRDVSGTQEIIMPERITEAPFVRMDEFMDKINGVELVTNEDGQGLSIRGGAIRETDVRLDGFSLRDPRSENSYLSLNSTSIEELQVLTGGFEAKYGGFRSGMVNAVTKEGRRDRYSMSLLVDYAAAEQKFFGTNPWSKDSWLYRVFADTTENGFAWNGTIDDTTGEIPEELRHFRGWEHPREGNKNYEALGLPERAKLTPEQKRRLWLLQHPQYSFARKPDMYLEGTITGPIPGKVIPLWGKLAANSTFMLAGKYESSQFAFPIGPRDNYLDWNAQLKITTYPKPNMKLSLNGMYARVETVTAGSPSNFGGALIDNSSRFNFLSSSEASVRQQARLLGGQNGFIQMFNKSRLQFTNQRLINAGLKFTHSPTPKLFYTLDFQYGFNDHDILPFALDTTQASAWAALDSFRVLNVPTGGSPNASTNWLTDISDMFWLYGGLQAADSSRSWMINLRGDLTGQWGRHHQIETGFSLRYSNLLVNSGTWLQSEQSFTPDTWQYFTAEPLEIGVYVQDKLEFKGMIANMGLRTDYFNPNKKSFEVSHPLNQSYADFYNLVYQNLPGQFGSWERWQAFRNMLESPPGWPVTENHTQLKLSPRLGVSFPITVSSKLFFNYGHFYQRPNIHFLYNQIVSPGVAIVPTPALEMARTVSYEFGYEQSFLRDFLLGISFYYKDIKNEPLNRTYIDFFEELHVSQYEPDAYRDIRGIEVRFNKNFGRFLTFWSNYDYMLQSRGFSGLARVYENRLKALNEERDPNVIITEPLPRAHANLNFHTPRSWGPSILGSQIFSDIYLNFLFEWRDGGEQIINPSEPESEQRKIEVVDFSNVDLRATKTIRLTDVEVELVLTVKNLLNTKRLSFENMSTAQFDRYKESLRFPFESGEEQGNDKLGDWDKEHIDIGWFTAPLFLNPRRVLLGMRFNF